MFNNSSVHINFNYQGVFKGIKFSIFKMKFNFRK